MRHCHDNALLCLLGTAMFMGFWSSAASCCAQTTYPAYSCHFASASVPVYFNPDHLAANGFQVRDVRDALQNALAMWNEESRGNLDLYYAGDTAVSGYINGAINVQFTDTQGLCPQDQFVGAWANWADGGTGDCPHGTNILVPLRDPCTLQVKHLTTGWQTPATFATFEMIFAHELGHAAQGFPDQGSTVYGIMNNQASAAHAASWIHLYPIDQASVVAHNGLSGRWASTASSADGGLTWGNVAHTPRRSTASPMLASTNDSTRPLRMGIWDTFYTYDALYQGNHGNWAQMLGPQGFTVNHWMSVARSSSGPLVVVWPMGCTQSTYCSIRWGWSGDGGLNWTTGILPNTDTWGTFGRVEVVYDENQFRFVIAYLDGTSGAIYTSSAFDDITPLGSSSLGSWSAPVQASQGSSHFRFMGGLVFAPGGLGLITAGTYDGSPVGTVVQASVSYNGANYIMGGVYLARSPNVFETTMATRRHFGMARSTSSGRIVLAFRGVDNSRSFVDAVKSSMLPSASFGAGMSLVGTTVNGVDVEFAPSTNTFVAGMTWL